MVAGDRQRIIETNRSLRIIKNELETLLEKGVLTDTAYDNITSLLPTESSLSSVSVPTLGTQAQAQRLPALPIRKASPAAEPVVNPPPAYSQSPTPAAAAAAPTPVLPPRKNTQPPAAPEKPVLCRAKALYKYAAQDSRDCSFDKDDVIHVYEYMNADWWMGRNQRTGAEGIFPRNYVEEVAHDDEKAGWGGGNEKVGAGAMATAAAAGGSGYPAPPPPGAHNPYNNNVPPMAVSEGAPNKGQEAGKKFGKKLGNAAIFGAGATMGSKIVNSIF